MRINVESDAAHVEHTRRPVRGDVGREVAVIVRCQSSETQECQRSGVSVTLASDGGWDVHAPDPGGQEIITHCKDWHRLERRLIDLGCRAITIQTGEARN